MAHLVFYKSLITNLRRTAKEGLISLLNKKQLEELAFKHFSCVNTETGQIGYQCPYTGIEFYNYEDIILEHIIPVSSMGGTVLFNCIPAYKGINGSDQKGANHLLYWWKNKGKQYYTPERLDKLLSYMFDAYDIVFSNHTIEEIENSYEDIDLDENIFKEYYNTEQNNDNPEDIKELSKEDEELKKQTKKAGVISYLGFINDCLRELKENNYDTTKYEEKLKEYEKYGYFENIERYTLFQNTLKDIVENMLGDKKTGLLTYTINFNISKLMDSMKDYESKEDIKNELEKRLNNIERILQENNLSTIEYFKSLRDIQDIDILYKSIGKITPDEIQTFLGNVKIGFDTKIDIFINMLTDKQYTSYIINNNGKVSPTSKNIFKSINQIPFKGYESIKGLNVSQFWRNNSNKIIKRLNYLEENSQTDVERKKYQSARRAIQEYIFITNLEQRIDKFIEMLTEKQYTSYENGRRNNKNIFSSLNQIPFKGYESIDGLNTSNFWTSNSQEIIKRLNYLEENSQTDVERKKYQSARRAIQEYIFITNLEQRIDKFIEMLTEKQYTSYENGKANENNIFGYYNQIPFKGYESIDGLNTSNFWTNNSQEIIKRLNYFEKNSQTDDAKTKYQSARRAIQEFEFITNLEKRIDKFIEMLTEKQYTSYITNNNGKIVPNSNNIFSQLNKIPFKGYESVNGLNTTRFWSHNSDKIIERLDYLEANSTNVKEKEAYQNAKRAIQEYIFITSIEQRIDKFIEMLTDKKYTSYEDGKANVNNIFKSINKIPFKGYESIDGLNVSQFWNSNSHEIIQRLDYLEINSKSIDAKTKYQSARRAIQEFEFITNLEKRIDCYIEMLTDKKYTSYENGKANVNNIFKSINQIPFKGYESIDGLNISQFWNRNSNKIIERINYLEENSQTDAERKKYQSARRAIQEFEFTINLEDRIDCYIEMLTDKKYTSYENGKPSKDNVFSQLNTIPFKGYESIDGLNVSQFWRNNSNKIIIPLLFFNKQYDDENKIYIESKKDYSIKEYDRARNAVLEYLQVKDINEYIDKLEQKEKKNAKVLELINLRNGLRETLELLRLQKSKCITENKKLHNEYIEIHGEAETRRAM